MTFAFIDLKKQFSTMSAEIQAGINAVLESGQFIGGPQVGEFEKALAAYCGVAEAVACSDGTSALEMPLMALNIGPGDAVFCPAFTFIATAEVVALRGARPIFVDIDPRTYNIDPADLEAKIEAVRQEGRYRPKAIIPVDLFGLPADYDRLEALADKHNLAIIEDAAQGFGGAIGNRRAGSFGRVAGTSFFPAKPLGCYGDGGAVLTNDAELAAALRSLRAHGAGGHKYEHVRLGNNSRLDTLQAAVLLVKLRAFPREMEERQRVSARYTSRLKDFMETPFIPEGFLSSYAQYTVRVPATRREAIMAALKAQGVPTMIYYPKPLHLQPAFAGLGGQAGDFPASEQASAEVMSLPMHPYLADADVDAIAGHLLNALK
ncbi:MAG: DegT/DnrJ/EryC1/StrS family aminotransferase [Candidatus Adiutrix sp.]|jgi:dTDP-4-amino-4,6-dideoxygalactose transaminase|nr:DegT/DnrJ/EryC1/StrS family aminotransferase [Candidatus Adiutrix sp.]